VRTTLLLITLFALPVSAAHATATVSATSRNIPDYGGISTAFSVVATGDAAGDELKASGIYGDFRLALGILVTDTAGTTAGAGCEQVDATSVQCMVPTQQIGNATVAAALDGGPGNDVLAGSEVTERLAGGAGDDVLDAATATRVLLEGGRGADRLIGANRDAKPRAGVTFDGGAGPDVMVGFGAVTYASRTRSVHVDLRRRGPVQGEPGEHDTIERARIVFGGRGDDVLTGAAGPNLLDGGAGADRFRGIGRGDVVRARDGRRDVVRCGRHPRRVTVDRIDRVFGCAG
jgi:Ca2+-binding RTX toxin-like protein